MSTDRPRFTHLDREGNPRMVDVGEKPASTRVAVAEGVIRASAATVRAIAEQSTPKGNVLQIAEVAGIMAGKRTAELIPLCHPISLDSLAVVLTLEHDPPAVRAVATARVHARTGVEMEALTAVTGALLTVYDMCKAIDRSMVIEGVRLLRKEGGRSGSWTADDNQFETAR